jgi:hypothetical protein
MPTYPFHPESRHTAIARCEIAAGGVLESGFVPCHIDGSARPEPLTRPRGGDRVVDYIRQISAAAGLRITLEWQGDWVRVLPA